MDNFRKKFIEEATEHIQDLEQALLELEQNPNNKPLIERVFRAMHSLKGSGAMFGFEKISEFTHNLETAYDLVRNGEMEVTNDLLNLTLASVDHLGALLRDDSVNSEVVMTQHGELMEKINTLVDNSKIKRTPENNITENISETGANSKTYYILFQPNEDIMSNGTNPLFLLDELHSIGSCIAIPIINKIPELDDFDPNKCYTTWEVFLSTE